MLKIVDVSSAQTNYKFGSVGEDGIIVKATEGTNYVNPYCDTVMQQAIKKNAPCGVYHFATSDKSAEEQATYFYRNIKGYLKNPNCIVVLDYETVPSAATTFIVQFIKKFKDLSGSKTVFVYGNNYVIQGAKKAKSPLWYAYYPYATSAASPATWNAPKFTQMLSYPLSLWQFTTSGDKLDRSLFYGDKKQWSKLSGVSK